MARALDAFFRQVGCMLFMVIMPFLWFKSLSISDIVEIAAVDSGYFLFTLGLLITIEAFLYLQLPLDLLPDCIPVIGKCDDLLAIIVGVIGAVLTMLGASAMLAPSTPS